MCSAFIINREQHKHKRGGMLPTLCSSRSSPRYLSCCITKGR
jgi:hypothetical protein